jgi:hypothetical protein
LPLFLSRMTLIVWALLLVNHDVGRVKKPCILLKKKSLSHFAYISPVYKSTSTYLPSWAPCFIVCANFVALMSSSIL